MRFDELNDGDYFMTSYGAHIFRKMRAIASYNCIHVTVNSPSLNTFCPLNQEVIKVNVFIGALMPDGETVRLYDSSGFRENRQIRRPMPSPTVRFITYPYTWEDYETVQFRGGTGR